MKKSGIYAALAIALTVFFYLLTYYFAPPPPSASLMILFAAFAIVLIWLADTALQSYRKRTAAKKPTPPAPSLILIAALTSGLIAPHTLHAQPTAIEAHCQANPATIENNQSTTITTQARSMSHRLLTYAYTTSKGTLSGSGANVTLAIGSTFGTVTITCTVSDDIGNQATATTLVEVLPPYEAAPRPPKPPGLGGASPTSGGQEYPPPAPPPMRGESPNPPTPPVGSTPGPRLTGMALLDSKSSEETGYGLYSYVLFAHAPEAYEIDRYLALIYVFLNRPTAAALGRYVPKSHINITYFPTDGWLPPASRPSATDEAAYLLAHYDYGRAQALLASIPAYAKRAPVIVSVLHPFYFGEQPHPVLVQDLSTAQPTLMSQYVNNFADRVAQDDFSKPTALADFSLSLRNFLETAAQGLGMSRTAVASWINISK